MYILGLHPKQRDLCCSTPATSTTGSPYQAILLYDIISPSLRRSYYHHHHHSRSSTSTTPHPPRPSKARQSECPLRRVPPQERRAGSYINIDTAQRSSTVCRVYDNNELTMLPQTQGLFNFIDNRLCGKTHVMDHSAAGHHQYTHILLRRPCRVKTPRIPTLDNAARLEGDSEQPVL